MKVCHENYKVVAEFQQNVESEMDTTEIAEVIFKKPLRILYNSLSELLKDNKVVTEDSVQEH
jgi:uncharacterized protein YaaW (UPF0174 family)